MTEKDDTPPCTVEGTRRAIQEHSQEPSLTTKPTARQTAVPSINQEPWQSWGVTIRYLVIRLAQAAPTVALAWLTILRR